MVAPPSYRVIVKKSVVVMIAVASSLCGCAGEKFVGRSDLQLVDSAALPAPATSDLIVPRRAYVLGPLDKVSVEVFGVPDLTRQLQIDATGRVSLPLAGEFEASGKSTAQLENEIASRLRGRYVRDPKVSVNLTEAVSQVVTVTGAVAAPGLYPVSGSTTLIRAVARAQGTAEYAREDYVVVFRRVNGRDMAALYDLRSIRQGIYPDPAIYPNDIVQVGDSPGRRLFHDLLQSGGLLAGPLVAILN